METSETERWHNGKMEKTTAEHFLVRFRNLQKLKFSPNWRAGRSGPE